MAGGRPSKYHTHVEPKLLLIEAWCRDGLTDKNIAENIGVSADSFIEYKKQYTELSDALKRNKEIADIRVENSLYKRAMGYSYDEITQESVMDPKTGKDILAVTKVVTKEVQPDTTAQIFWLKNRKPKEWRDKQEIEHSGTLDVDIERMNDDEILAGIETAIQAINNLQARTGTKA